MGDVVEPELLWSGDSASTARVFRGRFSDMHLMPLEAAIRTAMPGVSERDANVAARDLLFGFASYTDDPCNTSESLLASGIVPGPGFQDAVRGLLATFPALPFSPTLVGDPAGRSLYFDGSIWASCGIDRDGGFLVWDWMSCFPGQGHSERALRWLDEHFPSVTAVWVMDDENGPTTPAMSFWCRMHGKGLVDRIVGFDDHDITHRVPSVLSAPAVLPRAGRR